MVLQWQLKGLPEYLIAIDINQSRDWKTNISDEALNKIENPPDRDIASSTLPSRVIS